MIWREKRVLLIVLAALLLANAIFFFTYRVQYESRLQSLDSRLDEVSAQLQEARRARMAAERQVAEYKKIERDVNDIYDTHWSTQTQRLTALILEVKKLAAANQLTPPTWSYAQNKNSRTSGSGSDNSKVGASEMTISFAVSGSYQQIRRLINSIELSPQFVIIEQIGLSSAADDKLSMNLNLKTLFRDNAAAPRRTTQDL